MRLDRSHDCKAKPSPELVSALADVTSVFTTPIALFNFGQLHFSAICKINYPISETRSTEIKPQFLWVKRTNVSCFTQKN